MNAVAGLVSYTFPKLLLGVCAAMCCTSCVTLVPEVKVASKPTKTFPKAWGEVPGGDSSTPVSSLSPGEFLPEVAEKPAPEVREKPTSALSAIAASADGSRPGTVRPPSAAAPLAAARPAKRQAPRKMLAVLGFKSDRSTRLGTEQVAMLTDYVRQLAFEHASSYGIMTEENMEVLLKSHGTTLEKCAEAQCEVEFGRQIGADVVLSGRISKLGSYLFLNLKAHGTGEGILVAAKTVKAKNVDGLIEGLDAAAAALFGGL